MMNKYITAIIFMSSVSLVHADCLNNIAETTPTSRFTNNTDGSVTDAVTGLMWKKCSEGQTWEVATNTCTGTTAYYTWQEALQRAEDVNAGITGDNIGYTGWRVPNVKELTSILEYSCSMPSMNVEVFPPDTSGDDRGNPYWTSTIDSVSSGFMYTVSFRASGVIARPSSMDVTAVRLVRNEP